VNTENRIQAARRFYNGNVHNYRNKCESFPSNIIAEMVGFQSHEFFSVSPSVQEVSDVEFGETVSSQSQWGIPFRRWHS
jgi:LemA protein